jgi:hypothetical protein
MARTVAIIGNGPLPNGLAERIDGCECVIRFNEPPHGVEQAGRRTDLLFLVNSGATMQRRVQDPAYLETAAFEAARRIVLPYHPLIIARYHPKPNPLSRLRGRRADWTAPAIEVFGRADKQVTLLPPQDYDAACAALGIAERERTRLFPSTGFIGLAYAVRRYPPPDWRVKIAGFAWQGWKRHAWEAERAWVEARIAEGSIEEMSSGLANESLSQQRLNSDELT